MRPKLKSLCGEKKWISKTYLVSEKMYHQKGMSTASWLLWRDQDWGIGTWVGGLQMQRKNTCCKMDVWNELVHKLEVLAHFQNDLDPSNTECLHSIYGGDHGVGIGKFCFVSKLIAKGKDNITIYMVIYPLPDVDCKKTLVKYLQGRMFPTKEKLSMSLCTAQ